MVGKREVRKSQAVVGSWATSHRKRHERTNKSKDTAGTTEFIRLWPKIKHLPAPRLDLNY